MTSVWRRSSHSGTGGSQSDCVEVARLAPGTVGIRDSKDVAGPRITLTTSVARRLAEVIRAGGDDRF
ncbi:DUF397 domain-containing protein [Actinomadura logoneensis]|uniref:DUF397 domain-containing protein n=1 Tax=Actinomadura logoneensis TaxID=2293572 RepID=A0A372JSE4_9ACTN|nr:DUF397 domain-containing protein [Actinomadura logoneensis]RFU42869.1 DUF397 domain-containing protein [Actinomadura logoneensis]